MSGNTLAIAEQKKSFPAFTDAAYAGGVRGRGTRK
jgi:hypothetical protein